MGCAASTTASPAGPTPGGPAQPAAQQQNRQPPVAQAQLPPRAAAQGAQRQDASGTIKTAPLVKSMVSLHREKCSLERDSQGCHIKCVISTLGAGEATAYFLATVTAEAGTALETPQCEQVSSQRFDTGKQQPLRLLLCDDITKRLEGFKEDKDKYQLVLDLRVDSNDTKTITHQRSFFTFKENETPEVTKQMVQCGSAVRLVEALYGTMPNPREPEGAGGATDGEGGDCVICLSKPRDVVILHCRHVCLCMGCATITSSTWSFQCPVCRGRVAAMVGLNDEAGQNLL